MYKMDESIIEKFYAKLVKCLPMDDAQFRANLKTAGLFPGNLKSVVVSKPTSADKAECFLDSGINNDIESFSKLLIVMENSDYDQLKVLVNEIRKESIPSCVETDVTHLTMKITKVEETSVLDKVQIKLKTAYKHLCYSDNPHCYIKLALVRDKICDIHDKKLNEITRHTLQGHVDEILRIKEPLKRELEDIFHYNNLPCPRLILIVGAPGIGKTTLANELCLKWSNTDSFLSNDYDLVILIRLRMVQERSLCQVMIEAVGSEAAYDELLTKPDGKKCLIILEGLDETSVQWQQNDIMLRRLLMDPVFLSHANILVTSRPHACIHLHMIIKNYSRVIEIVGFDKPQIKEYAELYFHDSIIAEKFIKQVSDPHISSLCYVPLCLNMVLECFRYNNETLHTTLTELYQSFIISKVDEHIHFKIAVSLGTVQKNDEQSCKNLATILSNVPNVLSNRALETMFLLSKLAYKSYFEWSEPKHFVTTDKDNRAEKNPRITFTNKDLADCDITNSGNDACGLLKATNTLFATGNTAVYTFNHLSVQEYFCALHISLLPEDKQLQLFNNYLTDHPHMWPFYAGITKLRSSSDVLQYLKQYFLRDNQLKKINSIDCTAIKKNPNICRHQTIIVLNSIFEAQVTLGVCLREVFSLFLDDYRVLPYNCMSISYLMSILPFTHLLLKRCHIGDREAELLAGSKYLSSLKVLDLSYNNVTHQGMKSIITTIKNSTNLRHFSVFHNPMGGDGIQLFSLSKFKCLMQLNIGLVNDKFTEVDTSGVGECFKLIDSLQSLEIGYNNIKDNGIRRILNILPSRLVRLIVTGCFFTSDGAVSIAEMLKINHTLRYLQIAANPIGDDGISAISDSLHVNTTLIQLVARSCKFQSKGAESVAKMLQINKTLKYLDISNNQVGDDGMAVITYSIQINTTLLEFSAFYCELHSKGLESINKMLMINKTLRKLNIAYNNAEDVTVSVILETFFKSTCKLMQLTVGLYADKLATDYEKIENCYAKVYKKFILTGTKAAQCTKHFNFVYLGDTIGQYVSQLQRCSQFENNEAKDHSDDTEGWLLVDESESMDNRLPI